jgi:GTP-binding protein
MITNYIKKRDNLINTFVLIDCRHDPQKIDLEFMEWCGMEGIPFSIVFTKIDKLGSSSLNEANRPVQEKSSYCNGKLCHQYL